VNHPFAASPVLNFLGSVPFSSNLSAQSGDVHVQIPRFSRFNPAHILSLRQSCFDFGHWVVEIGAGTA
jgi:hypothetical protein